jgi:Zn ribbon nucleic-acid-binding protein
MWRKECTDLDLCRQCIKIERVDWWRENGVDAKNFSTV